MSSDRVDNRPVVAVHVAFNDELATPEELETYFKFLDNHDDALSIGHDKGRKWGTSTILLRQSGRPNREAIQEQLRGIPVISVRTLSPSHKLFK